MMTPQEVSQRSFAKASFGGYNMAMVDEFLDQLTTDYSALYKENAVLKSKIKVLVDKVEEYRSTDEAMRMALLAAQKMADKMVEEAIAKKKELVCEAETAVAERKLALQQEIATEEMRLNAARQSAANFIAKLKDLYQRELSFLESLSELQAPPPAPPEPDPVAAAAEDIENSIRTITAQGDMTKEEDPEPKEAEAEEETEAEDEEDTAERLRRQEKQAVVSPVKRKLLDEDTEDLPREIDFNNLLFGKDYEIK
jgi:cell division initiation protein